MDKYKHKSGSQKRKQAEQRALKDAANDPKQRKLSFLQSQVNYLFPDYK